jgi:hypothetical protein
VKAVLFRTGINAHGDATMPKFLGTAREESSPLNAAR